MAWRLRLSLAWLVLLAACGEAPARVILFVYGDYAIPDEIDNLDVTVSDATGAEEIASFAVPLTAGERLPLRLLLEPAPVHPKRLGIYILALERKDPVAQLALTLTWEPGQEVIANQQERLALAPTP